MFDEKRQNNKNDELARANNELLKRRAAARAELLEEYCDLYSAIKTHLSKGEYQLARQLALSLRETQLFDEIASLFQNQPETFHCDNCGKATDTLAFKKDSLTWIRARLCDTCENTAKEVETERQSKCFAKFKELDIDKILLTVGVSGRLIGSSYEGLPSSVLETCKRSVMGKHGLYIYGEVGRGKSCLSTAVLKDVIQTTKFASEKQKQLMRDIDSFRDLYRLIHVPSLLETMRASYRNDDYQGVQRIIAEYANLQVLILDDTGAEKPSAWVLEKLTSIVDFRNNRELKTLYTSNKNLDELTEHLDERITSRIRQQCETVHLTGPDRRRQ